MHAVQTCQGGKYGRGSPEYGGFSGFRDGTYKYDYIFGILITFSNIKLTLKYKFL